MHAASAYGQCVSIILVHFKIDLEINRVDQPRVSTESCRSTESPKVDFINLIILVILAITPEIVKHFWS